MLILALVGTYISFTVDAEIVTVGTYGAYGLLVDAWLPDPGVQINWQLIWYL